MTIMPEWLYFVLGVAGVLVLACLWVAGLEHRQRSYFVNRPLVDDATFSGHFIQAGDIPQHIPAVVRRIIGSFLEIPHDKIEPEMNLQEPIPDLDSLEWTAALLEIENELGVTVEPRDTEGFYPNTLRSWIEMVSTAYHRQHPR